VIAACQRGRGAAKCTLTLRHPDPEASYAYLWAEVLDDHAFEWFQKNGGLSRKNGDTFRAKILSRGNTVDLATLYPDFRGKDPSV